MIFIEKKIPGVFLINPEPFKDDRDVFRRHFCKQEFKKNGILHNVEQCDVSENNIKGTLRGFHYQKYPFQEAKTLSCVKAEIFDVVVDLRKNSKTYKKWVFETLSDENCNSIDIPRGCANAFLTMKNNAIVHYYCSQRYTSKFEKGTRFNDLVFNFKWPIKPKMVSDKDMLHEDYL